MKQTWKALIILILGLAATAMTSFGCGNTTTGQSLLPAPQRADPVIQWNRILLGIVRAAPVPGDQPTTVHPTRSFAIMHAAIYDAVNSIDETHSAYLVNSPTIGATQEAAASAAAHDVLVALYPNEKAMLDAQMAESLAQVPALPGKNQGIGVGQAVAQRILELRSNDGSGAQPLPYVPGTNPGDYQLTPPKFSAPVFTHWPLVKPFTLTSANQFRSDPYPALDSAAYAAAFQETKALGLKNSTIRTADQTQIARFWSGKIQNYWNEIAQSAAMTHRTTIAQNARLFALLNLSLADCVIAFYDSKYTYHLWRPVTAIQSAASNNYPGTTADPNWAPLADTPLDPSYPGAHSVISSCAASLLNSFFGSDNINLTVTSEVLPNVTRSFSSFSAAAEEAGLSRIYIGHHWRTDHVAGQALGRKIAGYVFPTFLVSRAAANARQ